jgi:hypothetical protein
VYQNLVRNFAAPDEANTPEYWSQAGAFNLGFTVPQNSLPILGKASGLPIYAAPDIGFNRIQSDIENIEKASRGDVGGLASSLAPFITAPIEYASRRDLFTGQEFPEGQDFVEPGGLLGMPQLAIATLLQQTNKQGQIDPRFLNFMSAINPLASRGEKLAPQLTMGAQGQEEAQRRQMESILRFMGAPIRTLTPKQQENEARRKVYEKRDAVAQERSAAKSAAARG